VARLPAELRRLHMFDSSIGKLGPYKQVEGGCDAQEPNYATQCCLPIEDTFNACLKAAFSKVNSNGNECKSHKEYDRKNQKNDNPNVWITRMTPKP